MIHGKKKQEKIDKNCVLSSPYMRDLSLAPIRFVQFVPRFVPRCRPYSFIISMGNHGNERETADLNAVGAKTENEPIPAWAKIYFDQQVRLLERMNSLVMVIPNANRRKLMFNAINAVNMVITLENIN